MNDVNALLGTRYRKLSIYLSEHLGLTLFTNSMIAYTEKIDPELSLPTMRSDIEQQLSLIALGQAPHVEVLQYFLDMFERKFGYFVKRVSAISRS